MYWIQEFFNFDNIGQKIKNVAKWACWIEIIVVYIGSIIAFVLTLADDYTMEYCWIPVLMGVFGPFIIWLSYWAMYAFGEIAESAQSNNKSPQKTQGYRDKETIANKKNGIWQSKKAKITDDNGDHFCNQCWKKVSKDDEYCPNCGAALFEKV